MPLHRVCLHPYYTIHAKSATAGWDIGEKDQILDQQWTSPGRKGRIVTLSGRIPRGI